MYSQSDLMDTKSQIKKTLLTILGIFALFLTAAIIIAKRDTNTPGMIVMVVGVCLNIFIWGMYGTPVLAYYRYVRDIVTGRSRNIIGIVRKAGTQLVYKDNKLFYYEILIEEDGIERVLLLDNQKEWPELLADRKYEFEIHENYIKGIREAI